MTLPKYDALMLPTLRALVKLGGSASINEIQDQLTEQLKFSPEEVEASYPKSGAAILPDRMSWARSYLKIGGFLTSGGKGVWIITEDGRDAANWPDEKLRRAVADAFNISQSQKKQTVLLTATKDGDLSQPDSQDWTTTLLGKLLSISPAAFERLCQRLLRESGFVKVEVTGKSGDGGIDGTGVLRMNLISFHVLFQCKRWQGSVSAGTVRDFRGAMQGRADKGLIITTGTFTSDARKEATRDGAPAIDLIDGATLCELLKERRLGIEVRERIVEDVIIQSAFFDELD